jgi:hypothetical protein
MKKFFFVLMAVIMTSVVQANNVAVKNDSTATQVTQTVTNSTVEKLVDKYSAKVEASTVALAQSLKQPAEHVYKVLIKQQIVNAAGLLFIPIGFIILLIIFYRLMKYGFSPSKKYEGHTMFYEKEDALTGLATIIGMFTLVMIILSVIYFPDILQGFINPEYGAMKEIVSWIK